MAAPDAAPRLIVNADDFGRSPGINAAILRAHREGILTSASLMVNGGAAEEAVRLARENPRLGVGLHLTLVCGTAALPPESIPGLVDAQGRFSDHAPAAGCAWFFRRSLRPQLEAEIAAQFAKFHATGLPLDHVNGHLNTHLHPVILRLLLDRAAEWKIRALRLTRDPFWFNTRLAGGEWLYRASHAFIYWLLAARARPALRARGIRHAARVYGLLQNARVDEAFLLRLIPRLPPGESELYSHPSLGEFRHELDALISRRVKAALERRGVRLIRHQDLS